MRYEEQTHTQENVVYIIGFYIENTTFNRFLWHRVSEQKNWIINNFSDILQVGNITYLFHIGPTTG